MSAGVTTRHLDLEVYENDDSGYSSSSDDQVTPTDAKQEDSSSQKQATGPLQEDAKTDFAAYEHYETNPAEREGKVDRQKQERFPVNSLCLSLPHVDYNAEASMRKLHSSLTKQYYHEMLASMSSEARVLQASCGKTPPPVQQPQPQATQSTAAPKPSHRRQATTGGRSQVSHTQGWNHGARNHINHYKDLNHGFQMKPMPAAPKSPSKLENGFAHFDKARYCVEAGIHTASDHAVPESKQKNKSAKPAPSSSSSSHTVHGPNCGCQDNLEALNARFQELQTGLTNALGEEDPSVDRAYLFRVLLNKLNEFNALQRQHATNEQAMRREKEIKAEHERARQALEQQAAVERQTKELIMAERSRDREQMEATEARLAADKQSLDHRERILAEKERRAQLDAAGLRDQLRREAEKMAQVQDEERAAFNQFRAEHVKLERELHVEILALKGRLGEARDETIAEQRRANMLEEEKKRLLLQLQACQDRCRKNESRDKQHREQLAAKQRQVDLYLLQNRDLEIRVRELEFSVEKEKDNLNRRKKDMQRRLDESKKQLSLAQQQQLPPPPVAEEPEPEKQRRKTPNYGNVNCGWSSGPVNRDDITTHVDFDIDD